ncbi:arginine repressor, partial [Staphylococcus succinus]
TCLIICRDETASENIKTRIFNLL